MTTTTKAELERQNAKLRRQLDEYQCKSLALQYVLDGQKAEANRRVFALRLQPQTVRGTYEHMQQVAHTLIEQGLWFFELKKDELEKEKTPP